MTLPRFSLWRDNPDLHNQLNRFVAKVEEAVTPPAATVSEVVVAPAGEGGQGVGAGTNSGSSVTAGTGINVTPSGSGSMVTNTGVVTAIAGSGIAVSGPSGNVTISAMGIGAPFVALTDATAGPVTVNLPAAATVGQVAMIQKTDATANGVIGHPNGTDTINGTNANAAPLTVQFDVLLLMVAIAGAWVIING